MRAKECKAGLDLRLPGSFGVKVIPSINNLQAEDAVWSCCTKFKKIIESSSPQAIWVVYDEDDEDDEDDDDDQKEEEKDTQ
ncbi:hypothetical protein ElyMa_003996400 [Elysia marginata]|uniref:Uncharacterized protein n=1 Tax=Elysia marginata TaxID=1093978 RepID=A0AAV4FZ88_9GAST|nr:hypothetical protein ElyMa_003996400 [Elysia marginata]